MTRFAFCLIALIPVYCYGQENNCFNEALKTLDQCSACLTKNKKAEEILKCLPKQVSNCDTRASLILQNKLETLGNILRLQSTNNNQTLPDLQKVLCFQTIHFAKAQIVSYFAELEANQRLEGTMLKDTIRVRDSVVKVILKDTVRVRDSVVNSIKNRTIELQHKILSDTLRIRDPIIKGIIDFTKTAISTSTTQIVRALDDSLKWRIDTLKRDLIGIPRTGDTIIDNRIGQLEINLYKLIDSSFNPTITISDLDSLYKKIENLRLEFRQNITNDNRSYIDSSQVINIIENRLTQIELQSLTFILLKKQQQNTKQIHERLDTIIQQLQKDSLKTSTTGTTQAAPTTIGTIPAATINSSVRIMLEGSIGGFIGSNFKFAPSMIVRPQWELSSQWRISPVFGAVLSDTTSFVTGFSANFQPNQQSSWFIGAEYLYSSEYKSIFGIFTHWQPLSLQPFIVTGHLSYIFERQNLWLRLGVALILPP